MEFHYNIHKTRDVKFPKLLPNKYKMLLYASEDVVIEPSNYEILNMGLKANLPRNTFLTITPKLDCNVDADGFEWNDSTMIDYSNTDEWKIIVYNLSEERYHIRKDDIIAEAYLCAKINNKRWTQYDEGDFLELVGGD